MQVLHVDSSISGDQSVSRPLTAAVVSSLKKASPSPTVTYRDLANSPLPQQSPAILMARFRAFSKAGLLPGQTGATAVAATQNDSTDDAFVDGDISALDAAVDEFLNADVVVLGAPMYNFGIPSQLKSWIDSLAVPDKTFKYSEASKTGLAGGKKLFIVSSRGGFYSEGSPDAFFDHQESHLTTFFNFIGITDITFVRAEGVNFGPEQRRAAIAGALTQANTIAA